MAKLKAKTPARMTAEEDEAEASMRRTVIAQFNTDGTILAAVSSAYVPSSNASDLSTLALDQKDAIAAGDLSQLESMLLNQAMALQSMFFDLALRAKGQRHREWQKLQTQLALKCAAGSRQAIVALAEMKAPRTVMFASQVNQSQGPQQINNGVPPRPQFAQANTHGGKTENLPNELLEDCNHEQWLDTRAPGTAGRTDPQLAAVGVIDRPANRRGQKTIVSQR